MVTKLVAMLDQGINKGVDDHVKNAYGERVSLEHSNLHGKGSSGPGGRKDGSSEISVSMMNQIYKVGINSIVMEGKGD